MRRIALIALLLVFVAAGFAAERKPYEKVVLDDVIRESQKSIVSPEGINLFWYVPVEYWHVTMAAQEDVEPEVREQITGALGDYIVLGVVRGDLSPFGSLSFHGKEVVKKSITVEYVPPEGRPVPMPIVEAPGTDAELVLRMVGPMLAAALGNMGQNFHLFLIKDRDAEGNRIVSPYEPGALRITAKKLGRDEAGQVEFPFPMDSLHIPRVCKPCEEEMHVSWNFCPWCGEALPR